MPDGYEEGVCDVVPEVHPQTGTVLAMGHNVYYKDNALARPDRDRYAVYVVRDADGRWLGSLPRFFKLVVMSPFVSQLPDLNFSMPSKKDSLAVLKEFIEAGKITPVVDRTFPLSEVPEAIRYLKEGLAQGKVVITLEHNAKT